MSAEEGFLLGQHLLPIVTRPLPWPNNLFAFASTYLSLGAAYGLSYIWAPHPYNIDIYIYIYILGHGLGYKLGPEVAWLDGAHGARFGSLKKNRLLNGTSSDNRGGPAG